MNVEPLHPYSTLHQQGNTAYFWVDCSLLEFKHRDLLKAWTELTAKEGMIHRHLFPPEYKPSIVQGAPYLGLDKRTVTSIFAPHTVLPQESSPAWQLMTQFTRPSLSPFLRTRENTKTHGNARSPRLVWMGYFLAWKAKGFPWAPKGFAIYMKLS